MPTDPTWCFENYGEAAEYIDQLEKQRDRLRGKAPTHWMPLPEPPK